VTIIEQAAKRLAELSRAAGEEATAQWGAGQPAVTPLVNDPQAEARLLAWETGRVPGSVERGGAAPSAPVKPDVELDLVRLEAEGYIARADMRTPLTEEYRAIKRPLLKNARSNQAASQRLPLIMVTSALPGEGKTYTAINLAMSIVREIDLSVLLVDADVVRRGAMARLGVTAETGLLDLLTDRTLRTADVVRTTNIPKLSLLPAGHRHPLATELLASTAMDELLRSLVSDFPHQVVIFDGPPLLPTTEAKVLAPRVGQVVLVVEAERTPRHAVEQSVALLEQCPIVMTLLNKTVLSDAANGYGYGYGYSY